MILYYWLIWITPIEHHPIWTRTIAGITIIKYLGLGCLIYAAHYLGAAKRNPHYFQTMQSIWFAIFFAIAVISYSTKGPHFSTESNPFITYLSFFILFFVTITLIDSFGKLRWVLLSAVGSIGYAALYLLREWQHDPSSRPGWVLNPNDFGAGVALCFPVALSLLLEKRPRIERLYCLGCMLAMLAGLAVAASRGGFFGLIAGLLVVMWYSRKRLRKMMPLAALFLGLTLLTIASPLGQRLFDPSRSDVGSAEIRQTLWTFALELIKKHPVVGIGLGMFKPTLAALTHGQFAYVAHNTYLEIAAEMGVPALFCYLMILFGSLRTLAKVRRSVSRTGPAILQQVVPGLQAGLLGCSVTLVFSSLADFKLFWLILFLTMCMPCLVSRFQQKRAQQGGKQPEGVSPELQREEILVLGETESWRHG